MYFIENLNIIHNITDEKIIDNLTFHVHKQQRLALIGEEGTGKTSLIKALLQEQLNYAKSSFTKMSTNSIINYVPQDVFINEPILHYLRQDTIDYVKLYKLLDGFNIPDSLLERRIGSTLSGGESTKLALVKAFLYDADLIILDEPTNNLDITSIQFLEHLCLTTTTPIIFSSHDTKFIENLATMILHFESLRRRTKNRQTLYSMKYNAYKELRKNTILNEQKFYDSEMKAIRIAEERYERVHDNVAHALRTTKLDSAGKNLKDKMSQVKSVERKIVKRKETIVEPKEYESPINLILNSESIPASKTVVDLNIDTLSIGSKILSKDIHLKILGPKKIAIIGNNGVGKTTLIHEIMKNTKIPFAYMPQEYKTVLDESKSSLELLCDVKDKLERTKTMTYLGSLSFTYDEMNLPFESLSGGQKAKVFFAKLALNKTQLLILDEPTRNISPLSMDVLIEQVKLYQGTVIMITHDRILLNSLVAEVYELTPCGLIKTTQVF